MADATVWTTIVSVLSAFSITKAKDEAGNEIDIAGTYTDGLIRYVVNPLKLSTVTREFWDWLTLFY